VLRLTAEYADNAEKTLHFSANSACSAVNVFSETLIHSVLSVSELDNVCVVLVATRNPLNIGAVARIMANFGFQHLRVVKPYDVAFREARSAVGAAGLLANAQEYDSVADAVADCSLVVGTTAAQRRDLKQVMHPVVRGAELIRGHLRNGRIALLFGSEKRGLSRADLSHCQWLIHIPTSKEYPSLNLAQAVAVCLYELSREQKLGREPTPERATAAELERITALFVECLGASGYMDERSGRTRGEKVRQLIRRLEVSGADAELLLGMLRQIAWRVKAHHKGH
jgi:tRNA/rRNA methyltransferase